jgi:hypothetical protein
LEQSCVNKQTEERDQESTQGFHDEGKRIIVEFVADYNTTINFNITDGSMDVGWYEYDRLLLTHETRSTDESDKAYEKNIQLQVGLMSLSSTRDCCLATSQDRTTIVTKQPVKNIPFLKERSMYLFRNFAAIE